MLTFRKKIIVSDIVLFLIFMALLFPFVERTVGGIVRRTIDQRVQELVGLILKIPASESVQDYVISQQRFYFQRVSLFDSHGELIYDTELSSTEYADWEQTSDRPEIDEAIKYGHGYSERYSRAFRQQFAFSAYGFERNGQEYILRIGYPLQEILELTHDFEIGFLLLGTVSLLMYSIMTWAILHRFSIPIHHIITAIHPYEEGNMEVLPRIDLKKIIPEGSEFSKLAQTLNSLSARVQKQIENLVRQRNETEAILESLGEGVIAVDVMGNIMFANRVACQLLGCSRDEFLGQSLEQVRVKQELLLRKCRELIRSALEKAEPIVQTLPLGDVKQIYLELIAAPLAQHSGVVLVIQDKTSDYKIVEMGKDFVANASHELRTPITIIRGFAETLHDLPDLSQEMLREIIEKIVRTSLRLDSIVKCLLTLADIESLSAERFHRADLIEIADRAMHLLLTAHPNVQIAMHCKIESAPILGDPDLIELAIMNLLENAVKYSPAPAQIDMTIVLDNNFVRLKIKDQGIGIPEADIPHIFDRFYTVDKARSRKFGGTGLGLSIVKTVMQKHNGEVRVASHPGQGSTFTLSLPMEIDNPEDA